MNKHSLFLVVVAAVLGFSAFACTASSEPEQEPASTDVDENAQSVSSELKKADPGTGSPKPGPGNCICTLECSKDGCITICRGGAC